MDIDTLQLKLDNIGAKIPARTLRDWAKKGLITKPEPAPRKTEKRVGRPSNAERNKHKIIRRGKPGRFYEWPEKSFEEAAAVWSLRNLSYGHDKFKKDNKAVKRIRLEAELFHAKFDEWPDYHLWEYLVRDHDEVDPSVVSWIAAVEKARNRCRLDTHVKVTFTVFTGEHESSLHPKKPVSGKRSISSIRLQEEAIYDLIELYICFPEEPLGNYNAYKPGGVVVVTISEAGLQSSRSYDYYPPGESVALRVSKKRRLLEWRAFEHFPRDAASRKGGRVLAGLNH
ncbi:MAG: hypothetical protein ACXV7G_12595 [Halobacteriota archaeon]